MGQKGWKTELGIVGLLLMGVLYPTFVPVGASEMVQRGAGAGANGAGMSRPSTLEFSKICRLRLDGGEGQMLESGGCLAARQGLRVTLQPVPSISRITAGLSRA